MINKISNLWAGNGDTGTAPTATKQDTGFVRRDKGIRQLFNWLFYQSQSRINFLVDWVSNVPEYAANREREVASALYSEHWANGYGDNNSVNLAGGEELNAINPCFIDGETHVMALDVANNAIVLINARTQVVVDTSGDLSANVTGTATALNFCTDNEYIYVVFSNTANNVYVHKYAIGSWAIDTNWTSGGQQLTGTWTSNGRPGIKVVDDSQIAIACPWVTITGASSAAIQVLDISDGGVQTVGAGDATTGNNEYASGEFASDGTNIFFGTKGGTSPTNELCSCTIANATAATGGVGFPLSTSIDAYICGTGESAVAVYDRSAAVDNDIAFVRMRVSHAVFDAVKVGTDDSGYDPHNSHFGPCKSICFDGFNVWAMSEIETDASAPSSEKAFVGFDYNKMRSYRAASSTTYPDMTSMMKGPHYLGAVGTIYDTTYDGRDLWCVVGNSYLYRIVLPSRR